LTTEEVTEALKFLKERENKTKNKKEKEIFIEPTKQEEQKTTIESLEKRVRVLEDKFDKLKEILSG